MRRAAIRLAAVASVATALLVGLVLVLPGKRELFIGIYELVVGGLAVVAVVASLRTLRPEPWQRSPFERESEKPERPEPVRELQRIDRLVGLGCATEFDLHYRLRPLLRELASERLHGGHGVELDRDPERASALLDDDLWELVRPDRRLGRRSDPGLSPEALAGLVRELEAL